MYLKRLFAAALAVALIAVFSLTAFASENQSVYVTICNQRNKIAIAGAEVEISDADGDGNITLNDALFLAHDKFYKGGAKEGYGSVKSQYGMSMTKLWGRDDTTAFGYYVNNQSALSLADPVQNGDKICAFVYADEMSYSDTYCFFDIDSESLEKGEEFEITLYSVGFDENWQTVVNPCAGANLAVDGVKTAIVTDNSGKAKISFEKGGKHILTAVSDNMFIVPAVCRVYLPEDETDESAVSSEPTPKEPEKPAEKTTVKNYKTGDTSNIALVTVVSAVSFIACVRLRKRKNEK